MRQTIFQLETKTLCHLCCNQLQDDNDCEFCKPALEALAKIDPKLAAWILRVVEGHVRRHKYLYRHEFIGED